MSIHIIVLFRNEAKVTEDECNKNSTIIVTMTYDDEDRGLTQLPPASTKAAAAPPPIITKPYNKSLKGNGAITQFISL